MHKRLNCGLAVTLMTIISASSVSGFELFTDRLAWETALTGFSIQTEDFSSLGNVPTMPIVTFGGGIVSEGFGGVASNSIADSFYFGQLDSDEDDRFVDFYNEIKWTFPQPVRAISADFSGEDVPETLQIFGDFDGVGEVFVDLGDELPNFGIGFLGVIGETQFGSISYRTRIDGPQTRLGQSFTVDNFSTAVPSPSSYVILAAGVVALGIARSLR